jgi:phosphatidylserine decarboxylase
MAKTIEDWIESDVDPLRDKSVEWLSSTFFFRDPCRPTYSDLGYFFSPADGIILYQRFVRPDECIVDIKGKSYSLRDALRDPGYDQPSLVIGVFMTFYDVHINRMPYPGRLSYQELDPIDTYNHPMLEVERDILEDLKVSPDSLEYLRHNQRVVNRVASVQLGLTYRILTTYVTAITLAGGALVWCSLGAAALVTHILSYAWMRSGMWRRIAV